MAVASGLSKLKPQSARDLSDFDMEVPMHRPDGQVRWMRLRSRPHRLQDGSIIWNGVQTDVTERKQAGEALRETRNYLENLIDYANAPIIVWDTSFKITRFNHAFERLTELKATEALGEPLDMLFPVESKVQSLEHIGRTLSGERREAVDSPFACGWVGSDRLMELGQYYDKDGKTVIATIAQGQDITKRKKAEEALRESRRSLSAVTEGIPDPIFVKDRESRIIMAESCHRSESWAGPWKRAIGKKTICELYGDPAIGEADHGERPEGTMRLRPDRRLSRRLQAARLIGYRTFLSTKMPYRHGQVARSSVLWV